MADFLFPGGEPTLIGALMAWSSSVDVPHLIVADELPQVRAYQDGRPPVRRSFVVLLMDESSIPYAQLAVDESDDGLFTAPALTDCF